MTERKGGLAMKKKFHYVAITFLIIATFLGIFAQSISYYLHEQFPTIKLATAITIITFTSIGLYILLSVFLAIIKQSAFLGISILIGFTISLWSLFVWAMGMG